MLNTARTKAIEMKAKYKNIKYVPFLSLPGAINCDVCFEFVNEDAHLTIVDPMQVLDYIEKEEHPELYNAIDQLKTTDFIGF